MRTVQLQIAPCATAEVRRLAAALGLSPIVAEILVRRGLGDPLVARGFLAAADAYPPSAFAGIDRAVEAIMAHVVSRAPITVHGDYDCDGVCSTAVLVRCLRELGGDVDWFLPDRRSDGYGLSIETVERLAARGTKLLITADCAITAVAEVAAARAAGVDVVVTDHHTPRADGHAARRSGRPPGALRIPMHRALRDRRRSEARPARSVRPPGWGRPSPTPTSSSSPSRRWPTSSLSAARTAASCEPACGRSPRARVPACGL